MTPAELTLELDKDIKLLNTEEMKALFEHVKKRNLPHINRMRRQMIFESATVFLVTVAAIWITSIYAGSLFVIIFFGSFAALFATAEIIGFQYYWRAFDGNNFREVQQSFHDKISRIAIAMKTLNITLGLVLILIVFVESNVTSFVPWSALIVMFVVKIMAWLYSLKWIALERKTKNILQQFEE